MNMETAMIEKEIEQSKLNLDTSILRESCSRLNEVTKKIDPGLTDYIGIEALSKSASFWRIYNTFLFPYPGFYELFTSIKNVFYKECGPTNKNYYIQSWLNWYMKDECIGWHSHSQSSMCKYMSGYYCVDAEPSVTTYKALNGDKYELYDIESKNDYVFYTKMNKPNIELYHRTWPWHETSRPRITIAFEILHEEAIEKHFGADSMINHWLPL